MARIEDIEKFNYKTIPIPDNATNGDVIKTLFNVEDDDIKTFKLSNMAVVDTWDWRMDTTLDWWNAPYKENTDGSNNN